MEGYFGYMFAILFTTLGPLKTIPVFYMITREAPFRDRANLALRSAVVATIIVYFVAFGASGTLRTWQVSAEALTIAGGIILFVTSIRTITGFNLIELPPPKPAEAARLTPTWMGRPTLSPLAVPTITTPAAVVAILLFMAASDGDATFRLSLLVLLGVMLAANLVGMLLAGPIMRLIGLAPLQIVGWVFAVLQGGLAVQMVIDALRRLHIIG